MARPWDNLSDFEFEALVGDLLGTALDCRFERFTRGPDLGIDLRHIDRQEGVAIVQAKHYKGSTLSQLRASVRDEARRLAQLSPPPSSYRLVTSQGLTPANKADIADVLRDWIDEEDHVLGRDDLEQLLDEHPAVERRHVKLWLSSGTQLSALLHADKVNRSRQLLERIRRALPLYVQGESFTEAYQRLGSNRVLVIAGPPGIGKTTLAHMLIAEAVENGFEPFEISADVAEAWALWDPNGPQAFLYDDFLGRTFLGHLPKNEATRLVTFFETVARSSNSLFVLTTREYILQQGLQLSEEFRRCGIAEGRLVLALESYAPLERARILHNHLWHSNLPQLAKEELAQDRGYSRIVRHANFSPRIIEYITGLQPGHPVTIRSGESWLKFAVAALDSPHEIWRQALTKELSEVERQLLYCLSTFPGWVDAADAEVAFGTFQRESAHPGWHEQFEGALRVVDESFVETARRADAGYLLRVANPGLADYLQSGLFSSPMAAADVLERVTFYDQVVSLWEIHRRQVPQRKRDPAVADAMEAALARCFETSATTWGRTTGSGWYREAVNIDRRVAWLIRAGYDPVLAPTLDGLIRSRLATRASEISTGKGDFRAVSEIHLALAEDTRSLRPDDWSEAMKRRALRGADYPAEWEAIASYVDSHAQLFSEEEQEELREAVADFIELEVSSNLSSYDEPEWFEELADLNWRFDVQLPSSLFTRAREIMQEEWDGKGAAEDLAMMEWKEEIRPREKADEAEMDRLFRMDK